MKMFVNVDTVYLHREPAILKEMSVLVPWWRWR